MLVAEANNIIRDSNHTTWIGKLYVCELKNVLEFDENNNEVEVSRLVYVHLDDTHVFEIDGDKTDQEMKSITEDYYGI